MALSKNATVANCLNSVRTSNIESAATEAQWMELLTDYFAMAFPSPMTAATKVTARIPVRLSVTLTMTARKM